MSDLVNRFLDIANNATPEILADAESWFGEANELAAYMTTLGDLDFDQACCIIAVFSIRQTWKKNVEYAIRFAEGERDLPVMGAINRIANNIVSFDDPYSALNGDKTNSFARNIAGDSYAVTLDVWMIRAAGLDTKNSLNKGDYRMVSEAVRDAALIYGAEPAVFQALIWIIVRGSAK